MWLARPFRGWNAPFAAWARTSWSGPWPSPAPADVRRVGQQLEWLRLRLLELDADKARFCAMCRTNSKPRWPRCSEGVALLQDV